jgi:hypothetical protein
MLQNAHLNSNGKKPLILKLTKFIQRNRLLIPLTNFTNLIKKN